MEISALPPGQRQGVTVPQISHPPPGEGQGVRAAPILCTFLLDRESKTAAVLDGVDLNACDANAETVAGSAEPPRPHVGGARPKSAARCSSDLRGCCGPPADGKPGEAKQARGENAASPPVLFDNLGELRERYEATLSDYRAKQTLAVNALIMLGFFGGLALASL